MARYRIVASASGHAELEVEADSEDQAVDLAHREHLIGIAIDGGLAEWTIEHVETVE